MIKTHIHTHNNSINGMYNQNNIYINSISKTNSNPKSTKKNTKKKSLNHQISSHQVSIYQYNNVNTK
jgi:hypothetical protein